MKSILSFFAVISVSVSVLATNASANAQNYQTMDLKQFDHLKEQSNVKVKVGITCKSDSGLEYKAGEMGYEQCVKQSASKSGQQNKDSKSQNNGANNTGTMEVTF